MKASPASLFLPPPPRLVLRATAFEAPELRFGFFPPPAFVAFFAILILLSFSLGRLTHATHRRIRKRRRKLARARNITVEPARCRCARSEHHRHRLGMHRADRLVRLASQE